LFSRKMVVEKMCLSISRLSRKLASAVSMRDRFSNTRKSRTREERPQRISRFNADLAENSCYVLSLANSSFSAAFPALLAAATVQKKIGECPIGLDVPARYISHLHGFGGDFLFFTTTE